MLKLRRNKSSTLTHGTPLTLRTAEGVALQSFDPEVVNSLRHAVTELAVRGDLPRRIAFVAALRGEGVTFTSLALGTILANDMSRRVCVVELNWWAPGLLQLLNGGSVGAVKGGRRSRKGAESQQLAPPLPAQPGLAQLLTGQASLAEALIQTQWPHLQLLAAGDLPVEQRPVMARSEQFRQQLDVLAAQYDHILFDVPAVLSTSDAIALASLSDACCVVIRQGVTPVGNVKRALDHLRHLPMLGVIMNQSSIKTPRWLHGLVPQE